ncbi:hypothetical protein RB595_005790 [Gaeumannomyces hyphopodioides]
MPSYIVTCKEDATPAQVKAAKEHAEKQGGKLGNDLDIINGFVVTFPEDAVTTMESHPHVKAVEADGVVTTQ